MTIGTRVMVINAAYAGRYHEVGVVTRIEGRVVYVKFVDGKEDRFLNVELREVARP